MTRPLQTAIVILNWNGADLLRKFLPSIIAYSADAQIWVADNASTDDSVEVVKAEFPLVRILRNDKNLGFAGGYNQALKYIDADIYALVNSDVEVSENWLEPILAKFQTDPGTAIIQPKILDYKNKGFFEYAGAAGGFIDKFGYPFCRGRIFETIEKDLGQYNQDTEIFWASGACFFIRKTVFDLLGGFDQDFFAHQEEIDLCWRAFNSGYAARYVSKSVVFHVGGATLKEGSPKKTYLNFRNSLLMLTKNLPANKLGYILLLRMLFDGAAALRFLIQGKPRLFFEIGHAHLGFYRRLPAAWRKRRKHQKTYYYATKNLLYSYFGQRKTHFRDLF